jgi:hypothetical protein
MRRFLVSAVLIAAACSPSADSPVAPQPHFIAVGPGRGNSPDRIRVFEHRRENFSLVVAGCLSEPLVVTGTANFTHQAQDNPGARAHIRLHTNLQGVSGVAQITGTEYRLAQVLNATVNNDTTDVRPLEATHVFRYRLIGSGPNNNSTVDITVKTTINANGETTVAFVRAEARCSEDGP